MPWSVYGGVIVCLTLITDKQRPGHLPITFTQNEHTALSLSPNIPLNLQSLPVNLKCRFIVYALYFFSGRLRIGYSETVIHTSANRNLDHTVVSGLSVVLNRLALDLGDTSAIDGLSQTSEVGEHWLKIVFRRKTYMGVT